MLPKKFYLPIGILILVICAVGLLSLRSDVPTEPIVIYKTTTPAETPAKATTAEVKDTSTTDTAASGHFHVDGTFHAEPHAAPAVAEVSDAEYNRKAKRIRELEALLKQKETERLALEAESEELMEWFIPFIGEFNSHTAKLDPLFELSREAFVEQYPTHEDRLSVALDLVLLDDMAKEFVSKIDTLSPVLRDALFQELDRQGKAEIYTSWKSPVFTDHVYKFMDIVLSEFPQEIE